MPGFVSIKASYFLYVDGNRTRSAANISSLPSHMQMDRITLPAGATVVKFAATWLRPGPTPPMAVTTADAELIISRPVSVMRMVEIMKVNTYAAKKTATFLVLSGGRKWLPIKEVFYGLLVWLVILDLTKTSVYTSPKPQMMSFLTQAR